MAQIKQDWIFEDEYDDEDPRQLAYRIRQDISRLALKHPEYTTQDKILMTPTMMRLWELSK